RAFGSAWLSGPGQAEFVWGLTASNLLNHAVCYDELRHQRAKERSRGVYVLPAGNDRAALEQVRHVPAWLAGVPFVRHSIQWNAHLLTGTALQLPTHALLERA